MPVCAKLETMTVSLEALGLISCVHWTTSFLTALFIGFEFASYTYTEQDAIIPGPTIFEQQLQAIYLIKSIKSEQTFDIVIKASPGGGERDATFGDDYTTGAEVSQQTVEFRSDQDRLQLNISLFQDDIPEGTETFQLISLQEEGDDVADFNPSVNATTTVFILDDDDCKWHWIALTVCSRCYSCSLKHSTVAIIELTPGTATVPEDVGMVQLCLNVTQPPPDVALELEVFVDLVTAVGSAGMQSLLACTLWGTCLKL